ncbi:MAG: transposase [Candidatus Latescibacteria bacterium]|nr:transposase [Candidatus Latescibacterota bacterium]
MQITYSLSDRQEKNSRIQTAIDHFFAHFHIGVLLNGAGIRKIRGARPLTIINALFCLPFQGMNLYWGMVHSRNQEFGKSAVYDILNRPNFNWRTLLLSLSSMIIRFFTSLTDEERETVLIIDDSPLERPRSKAVELLARVYDHCSKKYIRGFRFLCLTWSDGTSTAPVDFALLSSSKPTNRYQDITRQVDKRSCGYHRRMEAMMHANDLLEPMVKRALRAGVKARYILMDSWFAFPVIITMLSRYLPVICMLKRMPKIFFTWQGKKVNLKGLYRRIKKRPGKARILASVVVTIASGQMVKIVFVRNRRKSDWLALLSTDVDLADTDIVRIYGKRWDIEVFFKMSKQYLHLEKGVQTRNFDGITAHTTIAMMRYLFLSYRQRCETDDRTLGELFRAGCSKVRDISLMDALHRILTLVADALRRIEFSSEQFIQQLLDEIMGTVIQNMNLVTANASLLFATE